LKNRKQHIFPGFIILIFLFIVFSSNTNGEYGSAFIDNNPINLPPAVKDTIVEDTIKLPYPFKDESNPYLQNTQTSPLYLSNPSNIKTEVEYDPFTGEYNITKKVGDFNYRNPSSMTLDEYRNQSRKSSISKYWTQQRRASGNLGTGESFLEKYLNPKLNVNIKGFDKIFGSNVIDIKPQGSAELIFGINISKIENPTLPIKLQRSTTFDFDMKIQMGVTGNIGDKMKVGINYNTEATFDFENQTTLAYTGDEDELLQSIEAGNVSLPLTGTLITGSQSLFGVKTGLQFGKLRVTSVFSQQKSESSVIEIEGGAQVDDFELNVDEYETNRHFFLSHYFKDNYDRALQNLPVINTSVNITRVEVWVTNKSGDFDNSRNIIGFMDLAEDQKNIYASNDLIYQIGSGAFPYNELNNLYDLMNNTYPGIRDINQITSELAPLASDNFVPIIDYAKVENARLLSPSEYEIHNKLGYISINSPLNDDEVLAVAFEYTVAGRVYTVGEFSNSGINAPATLILKMLKGPALLPTIPSWDLMMKNVYSIGSYRINSEDFNLDIFYNNDKSGTSVNYIDQGNIAGIPLIRVMNSDQLNTQLDPQPDGVFDFMERITINSSNGRIFFPVREPFGSHLRMKIGDGNDAIANQYVFEELYDSTQSKARQVAEKSKFVIKGSYKSSGGSEISLNAINIPEGSVKASANGVELIEGTDYLVDYNLGRVTILNHGLLEAGTPIQISLESNSLFNINRKTLLGTHLDYIISDNFTLGGTILHLSEKPLTNKVDIGDEPISNTIWGVSGNYSTDFPLLTKLIDKLPFLETKEMSTIEVSGEFAHLIPGHSKTIGKEGNSYIDDFEGTKTSIDLKTHYSWVIASTPKGQPDLFPEGDLVDDTRQNGFNRAKIAWYNINTDMVRNTSATPPNITQTDKQSHLVREIPEREIFPNKESITGFPTILNVTNIAFYPKEKGPYNYDVTAVSGISAGIDQDGFLLNPESRWGGMMRKLQTNDFEATNIEFIEFWLMDPFLETQANNAGGDLYFNLGYISEDILKDSRKSFENGLPTATDGALVDETAWGRVPLQQSLVNAFDNDPNTRQYQDVGMDGLSNNDERSFFEDYLDDISNNFGAGSKAYIDANDDPSNDNYHFFRGSDYDAQNVKILERYKYFNGLEGNSPTSSQSPESYPTSATLLPDVEDINQDNTLNEEETYFQYKVSIDPLQMNVGENYITDIREATVSRKDMADTTIKWYLFKIPIYKPERKIGPISDFRSIRFMRLFMHDFSEEIVLRFARLDLVRSEWRGYTDNISEGSEGQTNPQVEDESYDVSVVSIEENGSRTPVNYVLPPGISRVVDPTNPYLRQLNEQSISMRVEDLNDGVSRSAYKNINIDIRQYKRLQMEVHGEAIVIDGVADPDLDHGDLSVFLRIGSDFKQNYYEYEIPVKLTPYRSDYDNDSEADRLMVWPRENRIDFELELLQLVKQLRNNEMRIPGSNVELITPFVQHLNTNNEPVDIGAGSGRKVTLVGNPNLSNVKTVMIGVRNPVKQNEVGQPKSGIIWMNELRVSDFRQEGGWASNARVSTKLADFGSFNIAGNTSKSGFGSIDKKINERQKEDIYAFDLSTNLEMGKFFPKKNRVRIPLYFGYSQNVKVPQYNPLDPDILLQTTLSNPELSKQEKDSIRQIVLDFTKRKSFNITNFKIEGDPARLKGKKKPFYHISNFSASFAFNEVYVRNEKIDHSIIKNQAGSFAYVFNNRPKNYSPFKKIKIFKNQGFKLIRDFNFYIMPTMFSFRTDLVRKYQETLTRDITNTDAIIFPTYRKDFNWNRNYDLKHSFTKALKFQYTANNKSRIDEPYGAMNPGEPGYEEKKDTIWQNIMSFGRNTKFNHAIMASYNLPLSKIPLVRWISVTARYKSTYDWTAAPLTGDFVELGNVITNSNSIQLNGQFNFSKIYNKVPYFKNLSQRMKGGKSTKKFREITYQKDKLFFKKGIAKSIYHNLKTENVSIEVKDEDGKEIIGELIIISSKKVKFKAQDTFRNASVVVTGKKEKKDNILKAIGDGLAYMVIGLKNVSLSVESGGGTILPGYLPQTEYVGLTRQNGLFAPGFPFVLGIQDVDFAKYATQQNWVTTDSLQTSPYVMTSITKINFKATLEPLKGLKIDISAFRNSASSRNEFWIADQNDIFSPHNRLYSGNFSMSFLSINTAFWKYGENYYSRTFENFKDNRYGIAWRLAGERNAARIPGDSPDYDINEPNKDPITGEDLTDGFPNGYGSLSQEVLIPSFLAAYSGRSANKTGLSPFPTIPFPNWRITYNGLSNITFLQRFFKTINLSHAYQSSYNVNSYSTNANFSWTDKKVDGYSWARDDVNELFIPEHEINTVTLTEAFNPLISTDVTWNMNLNTKIELRRSRTLTLSFSNNQLIDMISSEIIVGAGYRFDELPIIIRTKSKQQKFQSDLNLRADFSFMKMLTIIRKLKEDVDQITAGQDVMGIRFSADYALNERFNLMLFYNQDINAPKISTSFKTSNIKFGVSVRFTLIPQA